MPGLVQETLATLKEASARSDAVLVSYSDGKDSRVVMDLCVRSFSRVEAFFMYLVPGLECQALGLQEAERRWGVTIRHYPHPLAGKLLRAGVYCDPAHDDLPEMKLHDVYGLAMADTGIEVIATGAKRSDNRWRRAFMKWTESAQVLQPIAGWSKPDVVGYLHVRGIPVPPSSEKSATGVDLSTVSLLWLHDTFPADFRKLCEVFPYAEAVVWRRRFYHAAA